MDKHSRKRVVSWVAHHVSRGKTRAEVFAAAAKRKPPFPREWIEDAYPDGCQAAENASGINGLFRVIAAAKKPDATPEQIEAAKVAASTRICDIPGCKFPTQE